MRPFLIIHCANKESRNRLNEEFLFVFLLLLQECYAEIILIFYIYIRKGHLKESYINDCRTYH